MSIPTTTTGSNVHRMMILTTDENILHQIQTSYSSPSVQAVILNPKKKKESSVVTLRNYMNTQKNFFFSQQMTNSSKSDR